MADGTKIEWTDATWNVINGCSVVSPGCKHCYAMRLAGTRLRNVESREGLTVDTKAGPVWNGTTRFNDKVLLDPIRWKRPRRIFVCAHGDLFHDSVSFEDIDLIFEVMRRARQHQFQVLTKRAARMQEYVCDRWAVPGVAHFYGLPDDAKVYQPLNNVWLGVSVEDQRRADERRSYFEAIPAAVKFVSYEPALGPVDWQGWEFVNQIIGGGENGPKARQNHPDWHRATRDFCSRHGIAYFFKQWGSYLPAGQVDANGRLWNPACGSSLRAVKSLTGRLLDGVTHDGMPT